MFRKSFPVLIPAILIASCAPRMHFLGGSEQLLPPSGVVSYPRPAQPVLAPVPPMPLDAAGDSPVFAHGSDGVFQAQPLPAPIPPVEWEPDYATTKPLGYSTTRLPIIEYHYSTFRLGDGVRMETEWFESQLQWLDDNGFNTLTAEQLAAFIQGEYRPPARSVVLTFDVGASKFGDYTGVVIPALRRYGFHGIFFILASRTLDSCDDPDLTCWPMVKQWADEGIISVGSHSWSHRDFMTLTPEQLYFDLARSKALIEEKTGHTVLGICYPFDSVNPAAFDLLESIGYQFAVGGPTRPEHSATFDDPEPYNLPRYYPYSGDYYPRIGGSGGLTFEQMIMGAIDQ